MKQFDSWNKIKKRVELNQFIQTKKGEIYNALLGENIGFEQSGKGSQFLRPIVVFKRFSQSTILAIPLSTTEKRGRYYYDFHFQENRTSVAILSQIRLIDTRRLYKKLGRMKSSDFEELNKRFYEL